MSSKVTFKIIKGNTENQEFLYEQRESIIVGRDKDCAIHFEDNAVSRYHCYVDINPPVVMVRDLGSLNGTFLNGEKIGQRNPTQSPEEARKIDYSNFQMKSGDCLRLGNSCEIVLTIELEESQNKSFTEQTIYENPLEEQKQPPKEKCVECNTEIEDTQYKNEAGQPLCKSCHKEQEKLKIKKAIEEVKAREANVAPEVNSNTKAKEEKARAAKEEKARAAKEEKARAAKEEKARAAKEEKARAAKEEEKARAAREEEKARAAREEEKARAAKEEEKARAAREEEKARAARAKNKCTVCGNSFKKEPNSIDICPQCQEDPLKLLMHLLQNAVEKKDDAEEIAGYRNIKLLGKGGMGQVWLVEDERTGEQMALKVMLPEIARDELSKKMFLREAHIGCALKHESVVRHYKCGQSGGMFFILMELCKGGSVDQMVNLRGGSMGRNEKDIACATSIILQVLDGLHHTHNTTVPVTLKSGRIISVKGVVHRDFKPANIFIANEDHSYPVAKVADFGLAKAFNAAGFTDITKPRDIRGTLAFMPRQQVIDCKNAHPEVDAWAVAASYYNMLTGFYPKNLRGANSAELITEVLENSAVPIRKYNSAIPEKLAEVIDAALTDNPAIGIHKLRDNCGMKFDSEYPEMLVLKKMIWETLPSNLQKSVWDILPACTKKNIER
ncbi:MAG: protein kinase [Tannerella sp.]|jgi:serine/threonine protein kinase/pSer/pThr/pTyr-binding forkhead associated (FHA) protein|nr:protein kinase [Tannerella sp.]